MPGVSHVRMGDRFKTTRRVESRGQFVGERLIMGKAVGLGRADGLFVEAPGIEFTTFDPGDLGADQRGAIFEILRAIFRPYFQLSVVRDQSLEMPLSLVGRCGIAACSPGQRAASRFVFRSMRLYAANVRSPILFAASNARRSRSRAVLTCFVQGMTRFPKLT